MLDRVLAETLRRAWALGARPLAGRLVVAVDSFVGEVHGYPKQGAGFGYTRRRGDHPLLAPGQIPARCSTSVCARGRPPARAARCA